MLDFIVLGMGNTGTKILILANIYKHRVLLKNQNFYTYNQSCIQIAVDTFIANKNQNDFNMILAIG